MYLFLFFDIIYYERLFLLVNHAALAGEVLKITEYNKIYHVPAQRPSKPAGNKKKFAATMFDWVMSFIVAVVFLCAVFTFGVRPVRVDGDSMLPTLQDGNWLIVSAFDKNPEQGEIVIVTQPNQTAKGGPIVKRVIAVGGQEVNIDFNRGIVYVDGEVVDEPYILEKTRRSFDVQFPLVVPEGQLFVMGDNRNDSLDSRSTKIGFIDERYVLGSCLFRVYPFGAVDSNLSEAEK